MFLIDTHAHLDMLKETSPQDAVKTAKSWGVNYIINVGSSLQGSRKSKELSETYKNVFASIGIHPHYAKDFQSYENDIKALLENHTRKIVAIGETGLDYYRNQSSKQDQEKAFISQIELAIENNLALIIHDRDAHQDILDILKKYSDQENFKAVLHCFSGDKNFAKQIIDLGLYVSFTGILTFPNAKNVVQAAKSIPIERIFVETDTPFLAPQAKRGKENQPAYVTYIAEKLAEIKEISLEKVSEITTKNAIKFFSLK